MHHKCKSIATCFVGCHEKWPGFEAGTVCLMAVGASRTAAASNGHMYVSHVDDGWISAHAAVESCSYMQETRPHTHECMSDTSPASRLSDERCGQLDLW
jgi:hypothetical protein